MEVPVPLTFGNSGVDPHSTVMVILVDTIVVREDVLRILTIIDQLPFYVITITISKNNDGGMSN